MPAQVTCPSWLNFRIEGRKCFGVRSDFSPNRLRASKTRVLAFSVASRANADERTVRFNVGNKREDVIVVAECLEEKNVLIAVIVR